MDFSDDNISKNIELAIKNFNTGEFLGCSSHLLNLLGYNSDKMIEWESNNFIGFLRYFDLENKFNNKDIINKWDSINLIFQITEEEINKINPVFKSIKIGNSLINSYLFFVIKINREIYSIWNLSEITYEINKILPIPSFIIFQYSNSLAFGIADRRFNKLDDSRDVIEEVSLVKNINMNHPSEHHIKFLSELSLDTLLTIKSINNFTDLHNAWKVIFHKYYEIYDESYTAEDYFELGNYFIDKQFYEDAIEYYSLAISEKYEYEEAFASRGLCYFELGDFSTALSDFEEALALNPRNEIALNLLSSCNPDDSEAQ